jgi:opacity protein-like surface antigen
MENLFIALFNENGESIDPLGEYIAKGRVGYERAGGSYGNPVDMFGSTGSVIWFQWDNTIRENAGTIPGIFTYSNVGNFTWTLDEGVYYLRLARSITTTVGGSSALRVSLSWAPPGMGIISDPTQVARPQMKPDPWWFWPWPQMKHGNKGAYFKNKYPKFDIFLGYSVMRPDEYDDKNAVFRQAKNYFDGECEYFEDECGFKNSSFLNKGFSAAFTYNFTSIVGLNASFRYNAGDIFSFDGEGTGWYCDCGYGEYNDKYKKDRTAFLVGPRFTFRNSSHVTPFVYGLAGLSHDKLSHTASYVIDNENVWSPASRHLTHNSLGFALGGGLDIPINDSVAIRAIQVDYSGAVHPKNMEYVDLPNLERENKLFNGVNLSFGLVFSFGK